MNLLTLDPSITCMGYAYMGGVIDLKACGVIKPRRATDPRMARIDYIVGCLAHLIASNRPDLVLMEVPSGHINQRRHKGGGAGMTTYGMVTGECRRWLICAGVRVITADEKTWCRAVPKETRAQAICCQFPRWAAAIMGDRGLNISDAIALGQWYFTEAITGSQHEHST